ncbi:unnamed protein product [Rotaria socialis]|uniref:Pre-C2HC domain-containing protein n=1 Tax=Rotaria socialis TaxID=392032 RepID=A0A817ZJW1_9BILA|nr:unnamed protein product [Rotaria socialis]CAF4578170.1 unnamed protein product [Rotaria socialis]
MNINDESSTDYFLNPGPQTPRINKRVRSEGEESDDYETVIIPTEEISLMNINSNQQISRTQRNEYPPITIEFKTTHNKTDRKLIEDLIKEWRTKNNRNIDIIGRFGYKNVLLIFPRNASTLDDLLEKERWPERISNTNYIIKYPKILPSIYSLIIHDFQSTWNEDETTKELQEKYVTLRKLTRLVTREGRPMNVVRADFMSTQTVKQLLNQGEIDINCMKLRIRPYFSPIKINKCRKCFKHDHFTSQCTSPQLCFRCGQHHPLTEGCTNEIKCVNCQQHHYSGHSSCPIVQQRRKQLSEQVKVQRAQLLIKQHQDNFIYNTSTFPPLSPRSHQINSNLQSNPGYTNNYIKNQPLYANVASSKPSKKHENVEQMILAMSESINHQLSSFTSTITSQITDLSKKLNTYNDRIQNLEKRIDKSIVPAIGELSKIIDEILESKEQPLAQKRPHTTSCREIIHNILHKYNPTTFQTPPHKKQRPTTNLTQILSNINNRIQ